MRWKRFATGYGLLLTLAAAGLAFANVFGVAATALRFGAEDAADPASVETWMHVGWVFGAFVALFGAVMQLRKRGAKSAAREVLREEVHEPQQSSPEGARHGFVASAEWGGIFGALSGAALGVTFILLWFSIAYSPFCPQ